MRDLEITLHKDLTDYENTALPNFKLTPFVIKVMNAVGTLNVALTRHVKGIMKSSVTIHGKDGGKFVLTIYAPKNCPPNIPCLVYYHGGAFVLRDFGYMHKKTCQYALGSGCKVVLVQYRLAPKYPSTIVLEDCYTSLEWVHEHADELEIDRDRIAVGGDSAGGALAAGVSQLSRDRDGPKICFQMLIYPVTDSSQKTESAIKFVNTPGWNANLNKQMWLLYLKNAEPKMMKYISPNSNLSLKNLPDAYVEVEEWDCLRDEGIDYAKKLKTDGNKVKLNYLKGTFHGFDISLNKGVVKDALNERINALTDAFSKNK